MSSQNQDTSDSLEENLTAIIQYEWGPNHQERYSYLVERRKTEALTKEEHSELMTYSEQYVERTAQQGIERAKALVKLAELRQVHPSVLLKELLPKTPIPINLDDIQPIAEVTIAIGCLEPRKILIEFAQTLNADAFADVLEDLKALKGDGAIKGIINLSCPVQFVLLVDRNLGSFTLAERIAQSLEQKHHLTVQRLVSDRMADDQRRRQPILSFWKAISKDKLPMR